MPKQKTIRVSDPELFNECRELLKTEFGDTLTDAQVITSALNWLKLGRTQQLIPTETAIEQAKAGADKAILETRRSYLPALAEASTQLINHLMAAGLLARGDYLVDADPETMQIAVYKNGQMVLSDQSEGKTEPAQPPDWVNALLPKKQAVN